ncbi:MAG: NINE protein [Slackia sp.]|nr:NINE protein [Slackia sp.]
MADETTKPASPADEIAELKSMMERMQERLAELSAAAERDRADASAEKGSDVSAGEEPSDSACADKSESAFEDGEGVAAGGSADAGETARSAASDTEGDGGVSAAAVGVEASAAPAAEADGKDAVPFVSAPVADPALSAVPVEPVPAAPDAPGAFGAARTAPQQPLFNSEQGYVSYNPPVQSVPVAQDAHAPRVGAPVPPPAYDASSAYTGAAQSARAEYAQPTGQQAYQNGAPHATAFGASAQMPYSPYGQNFRPQPVVRTKDHVAAALLGIFLGAFGIHKFYLGYNTAGFIMLGVSILGGLLSLGLATGVIWLIGLIEGIIYLVKSQAEFEQAYVFAKREWF